MSTFLAFGTASSGNGPDLLEAETQREPLLGDWNGTKGLIAVREREIAKVDSYFGSYSSIGIHKEMLDDKVRTQTYRRAMMNSSALFKDKVVLDLGAGTLILSLFAIEAGAKRVYAVDKAAITRHWDSIIKENGMHGRIIGIKGQIEDIELPEQVDIIVSEWMGYWLLFQMMVNSVIDARDRWLKPGGHMFPHHATMYMGFGNCPNFHHSKVGYWDNVYGYKMPSLKSENKNEVFVGQLPADRLVGEPIELASFDLTKMEQLSSAKYASGSISVTFNQPTTLYELVGWFSVSFPDGTKLGTGPKDPQTHWKQCIMLLPIPIETDRGTEVSGVVEVAAHRTHNRKLMVECYLKAGNTAQQQKYCFV